MRQSKQSKQWMVEALLKLIKEKPYSAITVKDITEKAGVARLTFYRNFTTKEDILAYYFEGRFSQYLAALKNVGCDDIVHALTLCFEIWNEDRFLLNALINDGMEYVIYSPISGCLETILNYFNALDDLKPAQKHFLVGGLFATMLELAKNESMWPEATANSILEIIRI